MSENKRNVTTKKLRTWKLNKRFGDATKLSAQYGMSKTIYSMALNYGLCTESVEKDIDKYFGISQ